MVNDRYNVIININNRHRLKIRVDILPSQVGELRIIEGKYRFKMSLYNLVIVYIYI